MNLDVLYSACRNPAEQAAVEHEAHRRFALIKWEREGGIKRALAALHRIESRESWPDTLVGRIKFALRTHGPLTAANLEVILDEPVHTATLEALDRQNEIKASKELLPDARGYQRWLNVWRLVETAICLWMLLLASPAMAQVKGATALLSLSRPMSAAPVVINTNRGATITLAWNPPVDSSVTGYHLYASSNRFDWQLVARSTQPTATHSNVFIPTWWLVRSVAGTEESRDSNWIGWTGTDTELIVAGEASPDLSTWTEYAIVFRGTNLPGMKFFRTRATTKNHQRIETLNP